MESSESKPAGTEEFGHHGHCRHHGRGRGWKKGWKFIPIFIAVIALKGLFTMLLWNALIPDLFHGPVVSFVQAVGLIVLAKLVVGFHGPLHRFGHHRRWSHLSREEREKIREHLRSPN